MCCLLTMVGNFKILLLSLTLALFLAPGISQACNKKEKQVIKTATSSQTFIKQSFAQIQPSCDSDDCKDKCCHTKSHNCQTEGCSGNCSGNLCSSAQYTLLVYRNFLEDSKTEASGYYSKNSNFYYQNPHYSCEFHTVWKPPKIG